MIRFTGNNTFSVGRAAFCGLCLTALFMGGVLTSCQDDPYNNNLIVRDDGVEAVDAELLGGVSTVFNSTGGAYDIPAPWLSGDYLTRFNRGNSMYDRTRSSDAESYGGKGPVFVGHSCASCHFNAGRTTPTFGTGDSFSTQLIYITKKNGTFIQSYGRVLHDQTVYGVTPEGKLNVDWIEQEYSFPDGEKYSLHYPKYTVTEWYAEPYDDSNMFISVRIPLRHVGMGLIMALDTKEIEALAAKSNYPEYGISGRCNYVKEKGVLGVGVGGNKAQHHDLTVELGFSSDMGVTNSRFPEEIAEGQQQMWEMIGAVGFANYGLQVSTQDMENVDLYMQSLGVPARRYCNPADTLRAGAAYKRMFRNCQEGEQLFYKAKCHLCHVTTLHTKPRGSVLLNGTTLPWLGGQTIHPYSDFLLHDMGSEIMGVGLNDNYVSGLARGNEWRTTPLWGIGLQEKVNTHTYFLHDGRARNFVEAIMWHGGEAEASKNIFKNMTKEERGKLINFLESL